MLSPIFYIIFRGLSGKVQTLHACKLQGLPGSSVVETRGFNSFEGRATTFLSSIKKKKKKSVFFFEGGRPLRSKMEERPRRFFQKLAGGFWKEGI